MKCEDIQEWFGIYWDLSEDDARRKQVDEHLTHCPACAEEFEMWQESTMLIRTIADTEGAVLPGGGVSSSVMDRIYRDEAWRLPVTERLHQFSTKLRRNLAAAIAVCIMAFLFTFWISINQNQSFEAALPESPVFGRIGDPVVAASGSPAESLNVHAMPTAVASLKGFNKPFTYQVGPIHSVSDYLLFLSLLGLTSTLLIMNWLSRTRH
ncbi:anti-sigma factor family protein [Paenibacillus puerhi]|uniref:anti-sigma factor family protein n=1 Tax=Paenibacillus puerhi TaxID=2692622 RepID=UPI001358025F|nr:zf-HC2 domain-containing protein [Paenibacillus puerhi]